jgi:hypothetical protein
MAGIIASCSLALVSACVWHSAQASNWCAVWLNTAEVNHCCGCFTGAKTGSAIVTRIKRHAAVRGLVA